MVRIGLLSDTHGYLPPHWAVFMKDVDEIWHAGDVGDMAILDSLSRFKSVRCVFGNIDGSAIRMRCPEQLLFTIGGLKVLMRHIGGYPGRYDSRALELIQKHSPGLFISGHSHILKVMPDPVYKLLHINPGAAGKYGMHQLITMMRFIIDEGKVKELEISEIPRYRRRTTNEAGPQI